MSVHLDCVERGRPANVEAVTRGAAKAQVRDDFGHYALTDREGLRTGSRTANIEGCRRENRRRRKSLVVTLIDLTGKPECRYRAPSTFCTAAHEDRGRGPVMEFVAASVWQREGGSGMTEPPFPALDAHIRLLRHLPADLGMAIVIVNHLRSVAALLHEILPRYTTMPVELITEGLVLRPNRVFIIPAQRDLHVLDGEFRLKPISKPRGWPDVITVFLRSLTQHWDGKLIAVIVSGYDGDGAAALCGIKEAGGVTVAQKLETAGQPDMPQSAIASGCIDFVLSPEDIAQKIAQPAAEPHSSLGVRRRFSKAARRSSSDLK